MSDALKEVRSALRNQGFERLIDNADTAGSYCRSISEAAYRGDELLLGVHLQQLRGLVIAMLKTFKEDVSANGQDAGTGRPELTAQRHREDQRPGNGVARN
jgi:hypothetical protein